MEDNKKNKARHLDTDEKVRDFLWERYMAGDDITIFGRKDIKQPERMAYGSFESGGVGYWVRRGYHVIEVEDGSWLIYTDPQYKALSTTFVGA